MDVTTIPAATLPLVDPQVPDSLKARRADGNDPAKVKKVAQEFEAVFVGMMMKAMRETVGKDKLTGGGHGEETFRSLLDQEYAQAAVRNGGIGLAPMLEKELTRGSVKPVALKGSEHAD